MLGLWYLKIFMLLTGYEVKLLGQGAIRLILLLMGHLAPLMFVKDINGALGPMTF